VEEEGRSGSMPLLNDLWNNQWCVIKITSGVVCGAQELGWGIEMFVAYQNNDIPLATGVHEHDKIWHSTSKWGLWNWTSPKVHGAYQNNDTPLVACVSGTPQLSGVLKIYDATSNFRAGGLLGPTHR
jgi:hypothetical protein